MYPMTSGHLVVKYGAYNTDHYFVRDTRTKKSGFANNDLVNLLLLCNGTKSFQNIVKGIMRKYTEPKEVIEKKVRNSLGYLRKMGYIRFGNKPALRRIILRKNKTKWSLDNVYIEATRLCNLSCLHCYNESGPGYCKELDTKAMFRLINSLAKLGVLEIVFTGGEPLVRKDIFELIKHAKEKNIEFSLFTNGTLLDEQKVKKLKRLEPKMVAVSLESDDPTVHDKIRGRGSFSKTLRGIRLLISNGIPVRTNTTLFKGLNDSQMQIERLVRLLTRMGVKQVVLGNFLVYGRGSRHKELVPALSTAMCVKRAFAKVFNKRKEEMPALQFSDDFMETEHRKSVGSMCGIGTFSCMVRANGDVVLCPVLSGKEHRAGNINEKDLKDTWSRSRVFAQFRTQGIDSIKKCRNCPQKNECFGGCKARSMMYNKKFNSPDLWACASYNV